MSRPSGLPKTGGRKKGTPNKRTLALMDQLELLAFNPVDELAKIVRTQEPLDAKVRADICLELISYLFPKRKAIEAEVADPTQDITYESEWGD